MNRIAAGYQPKPENGVDEVPRVAGRADDTGWFGTLALVALPVICCGLPLLGAGLLTTGAGAWLVAHGSLLAIPAIVLAAGLLSARYVRVRNRRSTRALVSLINDIDFQRHN